MRTSTFLGRLFARFWSMAVWICGLFRLRSGLCEAHSSSAAILVQTGTASGPLLKREWSEIYNIGRYFRQLRISSNVALTLWGTVWRIPHTVLLWWSGPHRLGHIQYCSVQYISVRTPWNSQLDQVSFCRAGTWIVYETNEWSKSHPFSFLTDAYEI